MIFAKTGYNLIRRLLQDEPGRRALSSHEGVFHVLGVTFVENQDNIFHHKKSFLQDIQDLLEKETKFLERQRQQMNRKTRKFESMNLEPDFGRGSMTQSIPSGSMEQ